MDIHEGVCHFCCQKGKVITNGILFTKIINSVFSEEILNSSEFSRLKARLNTCLLCAQKLLIIDKTRKRIEHATVNKHFNCILCNEDDHLVQIHNWNYLNQLLEELDCVSKIKKYKVCLECYYFIQTCSDFKKNLFRSFPDLQVKKIKLAINYENDITASKTNPPVLSPKTRHKLNSLSLSKNKLFKNNKLIKKDEQLYKKIAYILLERQNLEKLKLQYSKDTEKITLRMSTKNTEDYLEESSGRFPKPTTKSGLKKRQPRSSKNKDYLEESSESSPEPTTKSELKKRQPKSSKNKDDYLEESSESSLEPTTKSGLKKTQPKSPKNKDDYLDENSDSSSVSVTKIKKKALKRQPNRSKSSESYSKDLDTEKVTTKNKDEQLEECSESSPVQIPELNKETSKKYPDKSKYVESSDSDTPLNSSMGEDFEQRTNHLTTPTKAEKKSFFYDSSDSETESVKPTENISFDDLFNLEENKNFKKKDFNKSKLTESSVLDTSTEFTKNKAIDNEINIQDLFKKYNIKKRLSIKIERKSLDVEKKKKRKSVTFKEDNMVEYFTITNTYSPPNSNLGMDAGHTPKPKRRLSHLDLEDSESDDLEATEGDNVVENSIIEGTNNEEHGPLNDMNTGTNIEEIIPDVEMNESNKDEETTDNSESATDNSEEVTKNSVEVTDDSESTSDNSEEAIKKSEEEIDCSEKVTDNSENATSAINNFKEQTDITEEVINKSKEAINSSEEVANNSKNATSAIDSSEEPSNITENVINQSEKTIDHSEEVTNNSENATDVIDSSEEPSNITEDVIIKSKEATDNSKVINNSENATFSTQSSEGPTYATDNSEDSIHLIFKENNDNKDSNKSIPADTDSENQEKNTMESSESTLDQEENCQGNCINSSPSNIIECKSENVSCEQSECIVTSSEETINKKRQRSSSYEEDSDVEGKKHLSKKQKTRKFSSGDDNSYIEKADQSELSLKKNNSLVDDVSERELINSISEKYTGSIIFTPEKKKPDTEEPEEPPLLIENDEEDILSGFQCIDEESCEEIVENTKIENVATSLGDKSADEDTMDAFRKAVEDHVKSKSTLDEIGLASETQNVLEMLTKDSDI